MLTLSVRGSSGESTMKLAWLDPDDWRALLERAGFDVVAHYGWFDRRPYRGGEDSVWVAVKSDAQGTDAPPRARSGRL